MTLPILILLSVQSETFIEYVDVPQSFLEYVAFMVFRIISNLHCYNPDVSPEGQKGRFVKTIIQHCTSLYKVDENGEIIKETDLNIPNIMANLYYLFQRIVHSYTYTIQEHNFWRDFFLTLEESLNVKYPPVKLMALPTEIPRTPKTPKPIGGRLSTGLYFDNLNICI